MGAVCFSSAREHPPAERVRIPPESTSGRLEAGRVALTDHEDPLVLTKVFPIPLQPGKQAAAEAIVPEFAQAGPAQESGTLSFRVYRDPGRPDYLLFVEHFVDEAAYDAHTGSPAYRSLVAGQFAELIGPASDRRA